MEGFTRGGHLHIFPFQFSVVVFLKIYIYILKIFSSYSPDAEFTHMTRSFFPTTSSCSLEGIDRDASRVGIHQLGLICIESISYSQTLIVVFIRIELSESLAHKNIPQ